MSNDNTPRAGDICPTCPNPTILATRKSHFGRETWTFECTQAIEIMAKDGRFLVKCAELDSPCCVEDSHDVFVGSPDVNPLKDFFETTLGYLGFK